MNTTRRRVVIPLIIAIFVFAGIYLALLVNHGFSAADKPSVLESVIARTVRNVSIPHRAKLETNPLMPTPENLEKARNYYDERCVSCHGMTDAGQPAIGQNIYPKAPDLALPRTQQLSDGEIHYIIRNGVRMTGMPAWRNPHVEQDDHSWLLVLYIRSMAQLTPEEKAQQAKLISDSGGNNSAHYVGSAACQKCHEQIYNRWKKTPMANVVRDPRERPEAITPDLATNNVSPKFTKDQVAFVYGSVWKQRYFTKIGDDYFPEPAQWDMTAKVWRPYMVANGTDWWAEFYPPDNMKRPTGPTCDGCHSVDYNIQTRQVAEWNVGCERCHGPGSAHVDHATRGNILNPARMDYVHANDTCIQCHSQGRPLTNPIEGKYYDWPVGYHVGLNLRDYWKLEDHTLGQLSFTHFPDGTAHKNRMQGNDFSQSIMYRRGVTCFDCHDVHGTENYAQLRKPANKICLDCHGPDSGNGPRTATLAEHTHHKQGSAGGECVACHMPKIEVTIPDTFVSAHTFAFIPPAMTDKYKIPNPCTSCHADKTTAWAADAMRHWPERSPWRAE